MKRSEQLKAEVDALNEVRLGILDKIRKENIAVPVIDSYSCIYKSLTETQLMLEDELETYEERTRVHPDRMLVPAFPLKTD